jgi:hypothetical protein
MDRSIIISIHLTDMKKIFLFSLLIIFLSGCKKGNDSSSPQVDIYVLKSFSPGINKSTTPSSTTISDAVLGAKIVTNSDILSYNQTTRTFKLKKNISGTIKDFGPDKAFAVTLNTKPIYYGTFHPGFMSSLRFGIATIDPIMVQTELQINYILDQKNPALEKLDKRNDPSILQAFNLSRRLIK